MYIYTYIYLYIKIYTHTQWSTTQPSKNEILPFAMMWIEVEGIMLSEISQSEKDNFHTISLICGI